MKTDPITRHLAILEQLDKEKLPSVTPEEKVAEPLWQGALQAQMAILREGLLVDTLTGVHNRAAYFEARRRYIQVMIEVRYLFQINLWHGRAMGDLVLMLVAAFFQTYTNEVYRRHGDIFLLQFDSVAEAKKVIDAVHTHFRHRVIQFVDRQGNKQELKGVNFSLGIGTSLKAAEETLVGYKKRVRSHGGDHVS